MVHNTLHIDIKDMRLVVSIGFECTIDANAPMFIAAIYGCVCARLGHFEFEELQDVMICRYVAKQSVKDCFELALRFEIPIESIVVSILR